MKKLRTQTNLQKSKTNVEANLGIQQLSKWTLLKVIKYKTEKTGKAANRATCKDTQKKHTEIKDK